MYERGQEQNIDASQRSRTEYRRIIEVKKRIKMCDREQEHNIDVSQRSRTEYRCITKVKNII